MHEQLTMKMIAARPLRVHQWRRPFQHSWTVVSAFALVAVGACLFLSCGSSAERCPDASSRCMVLAMIRSRRFGTPITLSLPLALSFAALCIASIGCSGTQTADTSSGSPPARRSVPDLVRVSLPAWSATPGETPFERYVEYRDPAGGCVVRVTHWFPRAPGEAPIDPSPVMVLARRDVSVEGRPYVLLTTNGPGEPQSLSVTTAGRTAMISFTGCDTTAIDGVLGTVHIETGVAAR